MMERLLHNLELWDIVVTPSPCSDQRWDTRNSRKGNVLCIATVVFGVGVACRRRIQYWPHFKISIHLETRYMDIHDGGLFVMPFVWNKSQPGSRSQGSQLL
jgi:hypothetical protein